MKIKQTKRTITPYEAVKEFLAKVSKIAAASDLKMLSYKGRLYMLANLIGDSTDEPHWIGCVLIGIAVVRSSWGLSDELPMHEPEWEDASYESYLALANGPMRISVGYYTIHREEALQALRQYFLGILDDDYKAQVEDSETIDLKKVINALYDCIYTMLLETFKHDITCFDYGMEALEDVSSISLLPDVL